MDTMHPIIRAALSAWMPPDLKTYVVKMNGESFTVQARNSHNAIDIAMELRPMKECPVEGLSISVRPA